MCPINGLLVSFVFDKIIKKGVKEFYYEKNNRLDMHYIIISSQHYNCDFSSSRRICLRKILYGIDFYRCTSSSYDVGNDKDC